ncbi:MAG: sugar phosphate isomerase/epimerase [Myxococcales bacterium]|nr:sugar phosphate isomerase/epimerase [Myxococcales bacterium]
MNRSAYLLGDEDPDLPGQIDAAARAGFRSMGPDAFSIARWCEAGSSVEELADRIESAGMRTFELPALLVGDDAAQTRAQTDAMAAIARVLRPEFVQLNVESKVDAAVLDELQRVGDVFGQLGVNLAIEYLPWLPDVSNLQSTRALLQRAGIEGAGIIVDTWHFFFGDDTWDDLAALPLSEIAYVQFDDHPALESDDLVAETLGRRVMPGEGQFELERFCSLMRDKGFDGVVSCEILSEETRRMDLGEFAQRVYESSRSFWP